MRYINLVNYYYYYYYYYYVLEGQEQLKEQLEVMFKKRNWIDALPKSRSYNFYNLSLFF